MVKQQAAKQDRFPLTVTVGAASVKVYRVKSGPGGAYEAFAVADYGSGERRMRKFSDLRLAKAEALRIATALANQDGKVAALDYRDASALVRLHDRIDPLGVSLEAGADVLATAAGLVGVHRIVEACRAFAQRHPASREKLPLAKTADDYHAAKEAQGRAKRHLQDIKVRLGRFVHDHPGSNLGDYTGPTIQAWLDGLRGTDGKPLSAQSRRNFATVLSGFFEHCRKRGLIVDNPVADVEREQVKGKGDPEFYTPEEAAKLLAASPSRLVPALAIALFAGLRTAELCRLTWADLDFGQGHIALGADKAKTATRRLVPILPNLSEWLMDHRADATGKVWPDTIWNFTRAVTDAAKAAGVRRIDNGTRHSFVSYRVAATGDVAKTSLEAGNSAPMIFRHYRGLATKDAAEKFFGLRPDAAAQSVIPFEAEG
jgi:integrase